MEEKEELHLWNEGGEEQSYEIADQLTQEQRAELRQLLEKFKDSLQDQPGRTQAEEHTIDTGTTKPVKLLPYRLPYAYRDKVKKELAEMVKDGIATTSNSEWATPIAVIFLPNPRSSPGRPQYLPMSSPVFIMSSFKNTNKYCAFTNLSMYRYARGVRESIIFTCKMIIVIIRTCT